MYAYAKEKSFAKSSAYSAQQDENEMTEREIITKQLQRTWLPKSIRTYQQAFHEIYNIYGQEVYTEIWNALSEQIPLNSTQPITAEHMEAIADFIARRDLIAGKIYTMTTPKDIPVDITEIRHYL